MGKTLLQKHWYDGWFYAAFIDSANNSLRNKLLDFIEPGKTVLDVGCGTGGFTLKLAQKCSRAVGVDVSKKMIDIARRRKEKLGAANVEFLHLHAAALQETLAQPFDYATLSFVLHEMPPLDRLAVLGEVRKIARSIIILDYHAPQPLNVWAAAIRTIEFFAGRAHYTNFRDFLARGGLPGLFKEAGLAIIRQKINHSGVFIIAQVRAERQIDEV